MANYDSVATFDSGLFYDAVMPTTPKKSMAKVKLNLSGLADVQVIQLCNEIKTAMTGNANFTTPTPTLTALGTAITTAQTKLTASDNAQTTAKQAVVDKDSAITALKALATQLATYVDLTAAGDEAKILSSGMQVRASRSPVGVPGTAMNLFLTAGDSAGALDLQWDPTSTAKRYEVQLCPTMEFVTGVINLASVSKSKAVASGLTTGTRIWARVRALNSAGAGAWSDPATKIVP